jgi:hypothetical protein
VIIVLGYLFHEYVMQQARENEVTYSFTPALTELENDKSVAEDAEYLIRRDQEGFKVVPTGVIDSTTRIALVGDSHARQYWEPLHALALKHGFAIDLISKSACSIQDPENYQLAAFGGGLYCKEWNQDLQNYLQTANYELVINSNSTLVHDGQRAPAESFVSAVKGWQLAGHKVLLIRDNPKPNVSDAVTDFRFCIEQFGDQAAVECSTPIDRALQVNDLMYELGSGLMGVEGLDFTELMCPDGVSCPVIIDDLIVYRDGSHLTSNFALSLTEEFESKLKELDVIQD